VLKLYIEMIANELRKGQVEGARSKFEEALALVGHAVDSVRRLTLDLGPAIFDQIGGLAAMRGRVEGLGGRLHVESRPARPSGTRIEIDLPLKELAAP